MRQIGNTSVSCVGYNETKDSLVVFHGDVATILSQQLER